MAIMKPRGKHAQGATKNKSGSADGEEKAAAAEAPDEPAADSGNTGAHAAVEGEDKPEADAAPEADATPAADEGPVSSELAAAEPGAYVAGFEMIPDKKRHRGLKAFGITLGVLVAVAALVYVAGAVVFMGRFLPNTVIGDFDVSLKSDAEVAEMLDGMVADYRLDVVGNGFSYRMTGEDADLSVDSSSIVQAMHDDMNAWEWPMLIVQQSHDETDRLVVSFDQGAYEDALLAALDKHNETAIPPVNATIMYDDAHDAFVVKPEELGTQLDPQAVLASVSAAIDQLDKSMVLSEDDLLKPAVLSTDKNLVDAAELATGMVSAELTLTMGGQEVGKVNGQDLSAFVTINDNLEVSFREEEMAAWVDQLAAGFNTVDSERRYKRADGKQITVPADGVYGWEVDSGALKDAVIEGIKTGAQTQIEVPCFQTADVYNGPGERDWGTRYLDVDLAEQHVRFYGDDGSIIWESDCISGKPDGEHDTIQGVWTVNNKESPSKLIGYENGKKIYESTVQYWMPFEDNAIGFHDATWQPGFGGTMYADGYGSHGCVNLSYSAAESLYGIIEVGDVVVVHF